MVVHIPNPRQKKYLWLNKINPGRLHVRGKEGAFISSAKGGEDFITQL
jgi:hypothetical protein